MGSSGPDLGLLLAEAQRALSKRVSFYHESHESIRMREEREGDLITKGGRWFTPSFSEFLS
jgi:hypothetical protein